ncbi:hypothetical protein [Lysinibacillus sp. BPa_S21]|uniref:hypothetical protein n=1 Tax=Lysinibacillus sp. BPa_S21 TaxID=2932478 RepID=UPI002013AFC5|nr:hypothetical protein [Lysinibacillus sp. BPa_S21]MCL1696290.1 hypothetical protein [Lysinibacillus sp. BPa_S21]
MNITQLEQIYKSCLLTLREYKIPYSEKHEELLNTIISYTETDAVDLLDVIEPLHELIYNHENYVHYRELDNDED